MSPEAIGRALQLILAPVVMFSACSVFVGGVLNHYTSVADRIRALQSRASQVPQAEMQAASSAPAFADTDPPLWDGLGSVSYQITTSKEAAQTLGISERSAKRCWTFARSWLYRELSRETKA